LVLGLSFPIQLALNYHIKTRGEHFTLTRAGYNNVANTLAFMGREKEGRIPRASAQALRGPWEWLP